MWGITHRHCNIKETCDCILDIKNTSSNQACSTHHYIYIYIYIQRMFMWMHDLPYCISAPMHQ